MRPRRSTFFDFTVHFGQQLPLLAGRWTGDSCATSVVAAHFSHWSQLIISHQPSLPHMRQHTASLRHAVQRLLSPARGYTGGHRPGGAPSSAQSWPDGPAAVLGRRPVRVLHRAAGGGPAVFLALCSPRRDFLPQLHGETRTPGGLEDLQPAR